MKFNMGCGRRKLDGYVNVDAEPAAEPDQVWDLERTPWPWPDNCATEVAFIHSLEHMGGEPKVFLKIIQELYRICAPGARVTIHAPHPRHDNFISDPTHVRAITPDTMRLFDRALNEKVIEVGGTNSPLAIYLGVDFALVHEGLNVEDTLWQKLQRGELTEKRLHEMALHNTNVVREYQMVIEARKP